MQKQKITDKNFTVKQQLSYTEDEQKQINRLYERIINDSPRVKEERKEIIKKAFDLAAEAHISVRRKSGEPYIVHPLEVAIIVGNELELGATSIVCALLHDVVEDTEYSCNDIENLFSKEVANIIEGLTKISKINLSEKEKNKSLQAENFKKMLITLSTDVRVILIKLADRLHNMRTLSSMPKSKQLKISSETHFLYAPLAYRFGLNKIKLELENLYLKFSNPKEYNEIKTKLEKKKNIFDKKVDDFILPIREKIKEIDYEFRIKKRVKSIYSIWNKMNIKNISFEEIFDLYAIRLVYMPKKGITERRQAWNLFSIITEIYPSKPDRTRDWITNPKPNGYESLHLTLMSRIGEWVEVQIRSERMENIAQYGYAAHWKYKENKKETEWDKWLDSISEILKNKNKSATDFLDEFRLNLDIDEIFVFTHKGDIMPISKNSTALDFAFAIHSDIGRKSVAAKINFKIRSLNTKLNSGDQIEIITSDKQNAKKEWLNFVVSSKAKTSLKQLFKEERNNQIKKGKQIIDNKIKQIEDHNISRVYKKLMNYHKINSKDEFYYNIGSGNIEISDIDNILKEGRISKIVKYWKLDFNKSNDEKTKKNKKFVLTDEKKEFESVIASCCKPIPGDTVVGFKEMKNIVKIHKVKCREATKLMSNYGDKIVEVEWARYRLQSFLQKIKLKGLDKIGIISNITNLISKELAVNMRSISFRTDSGIFKGEIELYIHDLKDLQKLIKNISKIKGVKKVYRDG